MREHQSTRTREVYEPVNKTDKSLERKDRLTFKTHLAAARLNEASVDDFEDNLHLCDAIHVGYSDIEYCRDDGEFGHAYCTIRIEDMSVRLYESSFLKLKGAPVNENRSVPVFGDREWNVTKTEDDYLVFEKDNRMGKVDIVSLENKMEG